jgi:NAD(P)-dependent dehydrogenase (short-subunit alcohol dehydrogenase family)
MKNPFSLEGKTILVTGASSNIGRQIAVKCSEMGAKVIISARNEERLKETLGKMTGEGHQILQSDLSDAEQIPALVEKLPELDGIVMCAAVFRTTPIRNNRRKYTEEIFNTNTFANIDLVQLLLKKRKIKDGGSILFISSVAAYRPYAGNALYSATKGAINSFCQVLAIEQGGRKIRANCVSPGIIQSDMEIKDWAVTQEELDKEEARFPLGFGHTEDIAYAAVYMMSGASKWVTGTNMIVDGGQSII